MERPEWTLGEGWTYRAEIPGLRTTTFRMMVAEDRDDQWIVATDDRGKALDHALYSTNPVLGRITKDALSPYQSGEPVRMYEFPLVDRKAWTSRFFGQTMGFTAVYSDTIEALPGVYLPGFHVVARGAQQARVEFDYVEAVEWFSDFQVYDASGAKVIHLILVDYSGAFQGPYYFLRGEDLLVRVFTASTNLTAPESFTVDGDHPRLGVGLIAEGTGDQPALLNVTLKDPAGNAAYVRQYTLVRMQQERDVVEIPSAKGPWTVEVTLVGSARVDLRSVGLTVVEGQL